MNPLNYGCMGCQGFWGESWLFYIMLLRDRWPPNEGSLTNSREITQIVGRQSVGSMHVERSDPEKTRTLLSWVIVFWLECFDFVQNLSHHSQLWGFRIREFFWLLPKTAASICTCRQTRLNWESVFCLPLLVLMRQGRSTVKTKYW